MKMSPFPKSYALLLIAPMLAALWLPGDLLHAQSDTETKIRLMETALRAKDTGDFATARKSLEELKLLAPNDANVQRMLSDLDAAAEAAPVVPTANLAPEAPLAVESITPATNTTAEVSIAPTEVPEVAVKKTENSKELAINLAKQEESRLKSILATARENRKTARVQSESGDFEQALVTLNAAIKALPVNPATQKTLSELETAKKELKLQEAQYSLKKGDVAAARKAADEYAKVAPDDKRLQAVSANITKAEFDMPLQPIDKINPTFVAESKEIARLEAKGRSQYLASDVDGAQDTFRQIESIDTNNSTAKYFLSRIAREKASVGELNRDKTRNQMVEEVTNAWQRPGVYIDTANPLITRVNVSPLTKKLEEILIPNVNFSGVELSKVVSTLTVISEEFDSSTIGNKGVNIVLLDSTNKNPQVTITLRNLTLKRVLDFITSSTGYQYDVEADAVVLRPGGETSSGLDTEFFAVTRATVIRMTGIGAATSAPAAPADPFASVGAGGGVGGGGASGGESTALKSFLEQAGVNFTQTQGTSLAYDGASIIVTQTKKNLERIRNILNRYNDVKQVEIEAKFMEVQEGALDELGVNWNVQGGHVPQFSQSTGAPIIGSDGKQVNTYNQTYNSDNRNISETFSGRTAANTGSITQTIVTENINLTSANTGTLTQQSSTNNTPIINTPPAIPGVSDLGTTAGNLFVGTRIFDNISVSAVIRALSRKTGSDLLSSPKVTVLSGNPATIVVAQELRYPQSYGEVQSQVGTGGGGNTGGGSAGVTITAGTPQEFTTRNVGVELKVTPTVEEDDYSISLDLNPIVTEFEGFVEYGGQSVAISSGTTVTVPSGFYQPIFSKREITTKVTVWDGATLVMGGLTREEVKKVSDKVPILGDIPLVGRIFRSKGETSSKRNLLIFVTANLVSPGGSLKKQQIRGVAPSSLFQNPTVVTPASAESRVRSK